MTETAKQDDNKALKGEIEKGAEKGHVAAIITKGAGGKDKIEYLNAEQAKQRTGEDEKNGVPAGARAATLDENRKVKGEIVDIEAETKRLTEQAKKEKDPKKWMEDFMENAMKSGDMGMMFLAVLAMVLLQKDQETPGQQQETQTAQQPEERELNIPGMPKEPATTAQPDIQVTGRNAAPGAVETIVMARAMSPDDIADKFQVPGENRKAFMDAVVAAQKKSGASLTFTMDIDPFEPRVLLSAPQMASSVPKLEIR